MLANVEPKRAYATFEERGCFLVDIMKFVNLNKMRNPKHSNIGKKARSKIDDAISAMENHELEKLENSTTVIETEQQAKDFLKLKAEINNTTYLNVSLEGHHIDSNQLYTGKLIEKGKTGTHIYYNVVYNGICANEYFEDAREAKQKAIDSLVTLN